jgi:hypothetical protein
LYRRNIKKVLKEEAMQNTQEAPKAAAEPRASEGTWIRITFTLDNEHYRRLWQRAEKEHRTISDVVRENVVGFLRERLE